MAELLRAFGSSHSTMLMSSLENWLKLFDHVDVKAPVVDFDGVARSFDELHAARPADAGERLAPARIQARHAETAAAMDRLTRDIHAASLDALIIVGDDQRELFKDHCRPALAVYGGATIRNIAAPVPPPADWYYLDQTRRLEDSADVHYPCDAALASHLMTDLCASGFDITAVQSLVGEQYEGHAYSFIHRRYMRELRIPIVPIFLNTYYPPNVPTPRRCIELGAALRRSLETFDPSRRIGIMASGGLTHFLVNEALDARVIAAFRAGDLDALAALPEHVLRSGSSEIRNWMCVVSAARDLRLDWLTYVPAYRSQALTGVGLCFACWR